jgi:hypothetical protein
MKRTLVSVVSLLVLLAVGIGVGSLHYRHSTSIRELGARLDTLSREVSDLRTELSVRKPSEISAEQRKAILQVIADDRTEQKRQQVEDQQKRVLHLSLACADRFAEKYALTADQRTAFLEVLRLSREKLEALEKQLSELQLLVDDVDRDNPRGPGEPGALNHIQADPTSTDHQNVRSWFDFGSVDDGTDSGCYATGDKRALSQGSIVANLDDVAIRNYHSLGERSDFDKLIERLAVAKDVW